MTLTRACDRAMLNVSDARRTITLALTVSVGPLPRYDDLVALERQLRGHLDTLIAYAESSAAELDPGTLERLHQARDHLATDLGCGLRSACTQVRHLAHDCEALLAHAQETQ